MLSIMSMMFFVIIASYECHVAAVLARLVYIGEGVATSIDPSRKLIPCSMHIQVKSSFCKLFNNAHK